MVHMLSQNLLHNQQGQVCIYVYTALQWLYFRKCQKIKMCVKNIVFSKVEGSLLLQCHRLPVEVWVVLVVEVWVGGKV